MSDLEKAVQPILEPMFSGTPSKLDVEQQLYIANWITKTSMVFEALGTSRSQFFLPEERTQLPIESTPPSSVIAIWLARYSGREYNVFSTSTDVKGIVEEDRSDVEGHSFTIAIGAFVGQLIAVRHKADIAVPILDLVNPGERGVHIRPPIIPAVDWPPPILLDDGGNSLDAFAKRFGSQ